ncbi:MAG: heat-inducible transcription repressor HrcA [Lachnospiraceae bacterium]|nr:heat-inducible transcription repressor HrcA [Lachnospiraceae bacterium]
MYLELEDRKSKILTAIIRNYLETGEPVGSRTISKFTDLQLSSATIRNEMADLEEMGLIIQPHTSAGRIPTDKGYRFYVDQMMEARKHEFDDEKQLLLQRVDRMEAALKQLAKVLAANTNYATLVSAPTYTQNKLKFIQLSRVDEAKVLAVIMTQGNIVKSTLVDMNEDISEDDVLKMNVLLNASLNGLSVDEINLNIISNLKTEAKELAPAVEPILTAIAQAIASDKDEPQIYTSGTTNIFKYPELSQSSSATELIGAFEEKQPLNELVLSSMNKEGIQVYIGEESPFENLKDCSVVTANYDLGDGLHGIVGIVGPKRMDYERVVGTLHGLKNQLDAIYKEMGTKKISGSGIGKDE